MIDTERITRIKQLMNSFRVAAKKEQIAIFSGYASFPLNSCTWASFAFGGLLKELEPDQDWHLVNGLNPRTSFRHDWLSDGHLAVDITADQFQNESPFVGPGPPPIAKMYLPQARHELSEAHLPHLEALVAIRKLM